jgi:hypothetical protein
VDAQKEAFVPTVVVPGRSAATTLTPFFSKGVEGFDFFA